MAGYLDAGEPCLQTLSKNCTLGCLILYSETGFPHKASLESAIKATLAEGKNVTVLVVNHDHSTMGVFKTFGDEYRFMSGRIRHLAREFRSESRVSFATATVAEDKAGVKRFLAVSLDKDIEVTRKRYYDEFAQVDNYLDPDYKESGEYTNILTYEEVSSWVSTDFKEFISSKNVGDVVVTGYNYKGSVEKTAESLLELTDANVIVDNGCIGAPIARMDSAGKLVPAGKMIERKQKIN